MVLVKRKKQLSGDEETPKEAASSSGQASRVGGGNRIIYILRKVIIALVLTAGSSLIHITLLGGIERSKDDPVQINFNKSSDGLPSLGPHTINLYMATSTGTDAKCQNTTDVVPLARVVGDALVHIPLTKDKHRHFVGSFNVPISGDYEVEVQWHAGGCSITSTSTSTSTSSNQTTRRYGFTASGSRLLGKKNKSYMFADGAWIRSTRLKVRMEKTTASDSKTPPATSEYMWADPSKVLKKKEMTGIIAYNDKILLPDGHTTDENGFFQFRDLSNYELVCWVGSDSAKKVREAFLALRPKLFSHQRPFKFHLYDTNNFVNPDATWSDEIKKKFRKCKHVLISVDEPDKALSQLEYKTQVTRFIRHVTLAINDDTFPIWLLTNMESPANTKNCYDPYLQKTSDHPCNDVLKDLFRGDSSPFPSRVRLLDNTDLSLPQFFGELSDEVLAAVAMRIYILVGKQVKEWREKGQKGHINGLTRGDVEEPNFELVPYDWSSEPTTSG